MILLLSLIGLQAQAQTDIVTWTFEGDVSTTATGTGTASAGSGVGNESFPAGNGGGDSWSFTGWSDGAIDTDAYVQFSTSTSGFEAIQFLFDERRSGTGIRDFEVQYSTDGTTFTAIPTTVTNVPDNTSYRSHAFDLSAITALNNQATIYFRIYGYNAEASTGTWRFDNVKIQGTPAATTLFFSEYAEGSGSNKGLEIYNPSNATVDLNAGNFIIEIYSNGATTVNQTISLTGTITAQGTYVVTDPSAANATLNAASNQTGNTFFNGDDAVVLKENGTIIDVIGQVGFRPTSEWGTGLVSTQNNTIRRKCSVTTGDINPNDVFDPATEWDGFAEDTFDGFGSHCPTAIINVTGTPLTAFTTTALNTPSAEQSYQVSGTALTADITITAPANFQVSLTSGAGFGTSVTVPFATANAGNVTVFVRYNPSAGTSHSGDITNASTGAATQNVAVTGTVPPSLMTIAIARTRPVNEIVTIEGVLTAADQFGGPAFIQDATGGIAIFDNQIHGGTYPIGQSLRVTATRADFNNQIQLSNVTSVTDLGAGTPVVPQVITLDQLDAHRGELVKINAVTFPSPDAFLFGNSNYNVTNGANSGDVRIDGDTDLAGRTQPNTPCDVVGVVAYFQTASQLIPRFQADLPCTNVYVSPTASTVTACIALPKTLEVSTYNVEWFGFAQGGTPSGNTSPAAQKAAVKAILKDKNSDIYFLQEINNTALMQEIATELTAETPDTWAVLFSERTSYQATSPIAETQKVGFLYKSNIINPQFSYPMHESIHPYYNGGAIDPALAAYPEADKTRFWASGRLPFMMRADVTLNGSSEEVNFIVLHSRSGSAQDRYDMRRFDVTLLQDSISAWLGNDKVIMGGDYNDDVDESIYEVGGIPQTTSYDAFTTRPADYTILSKTLSDNGFRSTVGFSDMIDHLTVSNELANGYIANSVSVGYEYYDGNYERSTSDHFIVSARLEIVPLASCTFTATANSSSQITLDWADNSNIETMYVVEMSLDGTTGWTAITGSPFAANSINSVVTGLNASTQYFFRVRAEESATNFSEWVLANATTLATTPTPPTVTTLFPADDATNVAINTNLVLTFDRNVQAGTGNITVTDGTTPITFPIAGNADATVTIATNTVTINLTADLATSTSYNVLIATGAIEEAGTGADFAGFALATDWNFTTAATTPPTGGGGGSTPTVTTPTNFRAVAISTSQINLTWDAVNGATGYILYRGNTVVSTLGTVTSFEDTGLDADTFYNYRLVATNGGRQSDPIQANARTFPAAPSLLSVTSACSGSGGVIQVASTGAVYRIYADSVSTTPLFETNIATITSPSITETTTFYVSVVSNGNESTRTAITVNVNPLPTATILEDRVFSCASTGTITAEEVNGASYTWLVNGVSITTTSIPTYEATRSGNYQVRVTLNGCSSTSDITPVRLNFAPIAEIAQGIVVRSCESSATISARNSATNDSTTTYEWTRSNVVVGNTASISVSESGVYTLTVTQNGCSATDEITVEISTINPNVSFTASQATFCPEEEVTLTVDNPEQNVNYTWVRNGRVLRNITGTEYTTSIGGEYRVQASQNSCTVLSTPITIIRTRVEPVYLRTENDMLSVESITPITDVVWFLEGEENAALAGQMSFTPETAGNYSARVTFDTGCQGSTRTVYYSIPEVPVVTGEDDIIDVETIVYPNPSKTGIFRIQLSTSITSDVTFTITDNIGRVLESKVIKASEISTLQTLDLSQYAAGMYALTIDTKQGTVIKKIIIE
ncbi:Ig-like domain-containing protein [Bernardetia sp. OM2101]|uniref:Ig-like domain-containing protein n=1 Tax=Bernardetia sp. OM2101 TaxID=3344876 RepID=UPI0035D00132